MGEGNPHVTAMKKINDPPEHQVGPACRAGQPTSGPAGRTCPISPLAASAGQRDSLAAPSSASVGSLSGSVSRISLGIVMY